MASRNIYDLVQLEPIIQAARVLPYAPSAAALVAQFPDDIVEDIEYHFGRATQLAQTVPVRPFGQPAPIIATPGANVSKGELPPISAKLPLTERGMMRLRHLAGLEVPEELQRTVAGDAAQTTDAVKNTVAKLMGIVLSTGQIAFNENGVIQTIDFGVPAGNKITVATLWSANASVDIPTDLQTLLDAYIASFGGPPAAIIGSTRIKRLLSKNLPSIAAVAGSTLGRTYANNTEIDNLLSEIGLPPITPVDAILKDATGATARLFPDNKLAFVPTPGQLGKTQWGIAAEAELLYKEGILAADDLPGAVVVTMEDDEPVMRETKTSSVVLPGITAPEALVIATVAS